MKLLIIADDFTGALDTGVQLSKNNISTCVYVNSDNIRQDNPDIEVVVINGNLRHLEPEQAYTKTQQILQKMYTKGLYVYIKTDSVLRGNISAVFAAAINFIKMPLYFVPAFPELKRTTKNATAYVNGDLLENSVFAKDPRTPTTTSNIHEIINRDYKADIVDINNINNINDIDIDNDIDNINDIDNDNENDIDNDINNIAINTDDINIERTHSQSGSDTNCETESPTIYLFDCETNEQLFKIGDIIAQKNGYYLTAGCAGFAATFTSHIAFKHEEHNMTRSAEPALFISGSANAVTFAQLNYAKEHNYPVISLSDEFNVMLKSNDYEPEPSINRLTEEACKNLSDNKAVIFATATNGSELLDIEYLHKMGKNDEQIHNCIARYTSNLVKSILDNSPITNIVIFGGDMVAAILEKLGISKVTAAGEITAGVPLCRIETQDRTINLVTKSGGFGEPDLIPVIEKYLSGR